MRPHFFDVEESKSSVATNNSKSTIEHIERNHTPKTKDDTHLSSEHADKEQQDNDPQMEILTQLVKKV